MTLAPDICYETLRPTLLNFKDALGKPSQAPSTNVFFQGPIVVSVNSSC